MKRISKKQFSKEYKFLVSKRKEVRESIIPGFKRKYSYLHFDKTYFSEIYNKNDENLLFEIIFLTSQVLTNAGYEIKEDILKKCLLENLTIYLLASTIYEMDEGEVPIDMFNMILKKYPLPALLTSISDNFIVSNDQFSSFDVAVYSFVCAKSIIDAAIVFDSGNFPIDKKLINKLSWNDPDKKKEVDNLSEEELRAQFNDEFPDMIDDDDFIFDDDDFSETFDEGYDSETEMYNKINEIIDKVNASKSKPKRRKLLKQALEIYPECIDVYLFLIDEYDSFNKKLKLCDEALEISKKFIGDEDEFNSLKKERLFWLELDSRPFMKTLYKKSFVYYDFNMDYGAAEIWEYMLLICPGDNLGVRTYMVEFFLNIGKPEDAKILVNSYPDDFLPGINWTKIMLMLEDNKLKEAEKAIKMTIKANEYIPKLLLNKQKYYIDNSPTITLGSKHEAEQYCAQFKKFWSKKALHQLRIITKTL